MTDKRPWMQPIFTMTVLGTIAQLAMVVAGHYSEFIRNHVFALGGMAISFVAGGMYARSAAPATRSATAWGSGTVGGLCALFGIAFCMALGDAQALVLAFGTVSSFVTGLIGGLIGQSRAAGKPQVF